MSVPDVQRSFAVGAATIFTSADPFTPDIDDTYFTYATGLNTPAEIYPLAGIPVLFGPSPGGTTDEFLAVTALGVGAAAAGDIENTGDGAINSDNGECACRMADPSRATLSSASISSTTGALIDHVGGNQYDPNIMFSMGPPPSGGIQLLGDEDANFKAKPADATLEYDKQLARMLGMKVTDKFMAMSKDKRKDAIVQHMKENDDADPTAVNGKWASGTQTWANHLAIGQLGLSDCTLIKWALVFEAGDSRLTKEYRQSVAGAIKTRAKNWERVHDVKRPKDGPGGKASIAEVLLAGKQFSFMNRGHSGGKRAVAAEALRMAEMLAKAKNGTPTEKDWNEYFKGDSEEMKEIRRDLKKRWKNAEDSVGKLCTKSKDQNGADHYWVDWVKTPAWHDSKKVTKVIKTSDGRSTYFEKIGGVVRVPNRSWRKDKKDK